MIGYDIYFGYVNNESIITLEKIDYTFYFKNVNYLIIEDVVHHFSLELEKCKKNMFKHYYHPEHALIESYIIDKYDLKSYYNSHDFSIDKPEIITLNNVANDNAILDIAVPRNSVSDYDEYVTKVPAIVNGDYEINENEENKKDNSDDDKGDSDVGDNNDDEDSDDSNENIKKSIKTVAIKTTRKPMKKPMKKTVKIEMKSKKPLRVIDDAVPNNLDNVEDKQKISKNLNMTIVEKNQSKHKKPIESDIMIDQELLYDSNEEY